MIRKTTFDSPEDEGRSRLDELARLGDERKRQDADRYRDQSRARLAENFAAKLRTTMIGSIAAAEEELGWLWGQGEYPPSLAADEVRTLEGLAGFFDGVRERLRTRILNLGNAQRRAAESEIAQYDVSWNRHRYVADGTKDEISPIFVREDGTPRRRISRDGSTNTRRDV